jgi:hypothetical protein
VRQSLTVTFNGIDKSIEYEPHEAVTALLAAAKRTFEVQNQHLLALFTEDGTEITDESQSVEAASIQPGQVLVLRQSTVKGG